MVRDHSKGASLYVMLENVKILNDDCHDKQNISAELNTREKGNYFTWILINVFINYSVQSQFR